MDIEFSLNIRSGNAAFGDTPDEAQVEIISILDGVINSLRRSHTCGKLYDSNGNRVGRWDFDAAEDEDMTGDEEPDR